MAHSTWKRIDGVDGLVVVDQRCYLSNFVDESFAKAFSKQILAERQACGCEEVFVEHFQKLFNTIEGSPILLIIVDAE